MNNKKASIMDLPDAIPFSPSDYKSKNIPKEEVCHNDLDDYMFNKLIINWQQSLDITSTVPPDLRHTTSIIPINSYNIPQSQFYSLTPFIVEFPKTCITIQCDNMNLLTLPSLPPNLLVLDCRNNNLGCLPNLPDSLVYLDCSRNQLAFLPKLPPNLKCLIITGNQIKTLPSLPKTLETLKCGYNKLTDLVIYTKFHIKTLESHDNPLPYIVKTSDYPSFKEQHAKEYVAKWIFDILFKPGGHLARRAIEGAEERAKQSRRIHD